MQIVSVNIGREEPLRKAKSGRTGIFKRPVTSPVAVTPAGFGGDYIADAKNHGGPDQAVYVFGTPDHRWWGTELGYPLDPGTFGENILLSELKSASACIGDRFPIGAVVLEVTAPRIPCVTLARRMNDTDFAKRFIAAERPGLYCRVLESGLVQAGDAVVPEPFTGPDPITALDMFRDFFLPDLDEATLRRYLANPIASRARVHRQGPLEALLAERRKMAR